MDLKKCGGHGPRVCGTEGPFLGGMWQKDKGSPSTEKLSIQIKGHLKRPGHSMEEVWESGLRLHECDRLHTGEANTSVGSCPVHASGRLSVLTWS